MFCCRVTIIYIVVYFCFCFFTSKAPFYKFTPQIVQRQYPGLCPDYLFSPQLPLVALLLLAHLQNGESSPEPAPTYERKDPFTRRTLTCEMCPPGTRVAAHCTASQPTKCVPCGGEQYTELWNYLPRCLYCNTICYENQNQEVEMACSATQNRVCRCKEGFYSTDDYCYTHSECGPGQGVKTKGTVWTLCSTCVVCVRDAHHFKRHHVSVTCIYYIYIHIW